MPSFSEPMPAGPRTSVVVALLDGRTDGVDDADGVGGTGDADVSVVGALVVCPGDPAGAASPL
ncbi:hypothetical protein [Micromonospora sp. 067-2]|uniref:hypothetical protein n=1 Tax=Micromonospora sp. 067-2 TaxID=2789270 RepID=UPI003978225B